jgi:hypothetical protein
MLGDIYTGIFNFNGSSFVTPFCPTGDCAWNSSSTPNITSYASLGVCGKCEDSTSYLKTSCGKASAGTTIYDSNHVQYNITTPYCNYTLPNGLSLPGNSYLPYPLMVTSGNVSKTTHFQHQANAFSILSTIRANWASFIYENGTETEDPDTVQTTDSDGNPLPGGPVGEMSAPHLHNATSTECALYYCVRLYNAGVANGTFHESVLDTYQDETATDGTSLNLVNDINFTNITLTPPSTWKLDQNVTKNYNATNRAWSGTYMQFQNLWSGSVNASGTDPANRYMSYSSDTLQTMFELNYTGLQHTFDNIAHSMTNNIRQSSGELGGGIAYQAIPYVVVAWGWIALPLTLLVVALILLATTIIQTRKAGTKLWKTSSLAAFYHPLTETGRGKVGGARDKVQLDKISEDVHVKWAETDKGWRLVPVEGQEECRKVV